MASGIYQITNTVTGQFYIGSAVDLMRRKYQHFDDLRRGTHGNGRLQNSFNKYGAAAFRWEIIQTVPDKSSLIPAEQGFIDTRRPFFNICKVAGSQLGTKHSTEMKTRMRALKTGTKMSDATKRRMSIAHTGRTHTPETRRKISAAQEGARNGAYQRKHSADAIAKITATSKERAGLPETQAALALGRGWNRGIPFSEETRRKMSDAKPKKAVIRTDPATGEQKFYESASAARKDGFHSAHIGRCCMGQRKSHGGYIWAYS